MSSVQGPMNMPVEATNEALLSDIVDILKSPDGDKQQVILLIGRSGAGKSALINTIHKVLTGKYYVIAKEGRGEASTVSTDLKRYEHCGVEEYRITDGVRKEKLNDVIQKLPIIIDFAGLANENTRNLREILELLIGGFIPPGKTIQALEKIQEDYGEGSLKRVVFTEPKPEWKVTKIVFMQGCIDGIPKNLIKCLSEVLDMYYDNTLKKKYQCSVFVLITKYDLVKDSSDTNLRGETDERSITLRDFESLESEIAKQLNFEGAIQSNRIRWVNLTDNVGLDNLHVENIALKFLKKMVEPGVPEEGEDTAAVIDTWKWVQLSLHGYKNQICGVFGQDVSLSIPRFLMSIAVMVVVLSVVVYLLSKPA